jgi:glutamate synthase domain-containing protein 1
MTGNMTGIFKKSDYPDYKIPSGCAVFGILNESGAAFGGSDIIEGIAMMHDRSNGLGGGFAAYGIYPDYKNDRAFHVIYDDINSKVRTKISIKRIQVNATTVLDTKLIASGGQAIWIKPL